MPRTIIEKIWDSHVVHEQPGAPSLIYIDLHLVHEVTSPQAFQGLRERGLKVRRPDLTIATADHSIPTTDRSLPIVDEIAARQLEQLETNCRDFGIPCFGIHSRRQGIVHVIGPEMGFTQPGMTVVCGDSHTATHGAFGALAFGIGTSEVEQVLATQCLLQRKSRTFQVRVDGTLRPGVSAKDIILALIARIGIGGGTASVFEYTGGAIDIIFNDVDKEDYPRVLHLVPERLRQGGLFITDNVLWSGRVTQAKPKEASTRAIQEFNKRLYAMPEFFTTILPLRDGVSISVKL